MSNHTPPQRIEGSPSEVSKYLSLIQTFTTAFFTVRIPQLASKYDTTHEAAVIGWFHDLLGETLTPGPAEMKKQLMSGVLLCKLV